MTNPLKKAFASLALFPSRIWKFRFQKCHKHKDASELALLTYPWASHLNESRQDTTSFEIGVGVYRGALVTIEELGLSAESHRWVIGTLLYSDLRQIDNQMVQSLYCLAHRLAFEKQSSPSMQDLRKPEAITLDMCPLLSQRESSLLFSSEVVHGNDDIQQPPNKQIDQAQMPPQSKQLNPKLKTHFLGKCLQYSCPLLYHNGNSLNIESQEVK